ncbi:MAG: hypothetical protein JRN21_01710 [Nitrososphaerota archaeon]|nr:hypothetical protein [Nitrososphaerota archaeon]
MCHRFNFKEGISAGTHTPSITQLLMTKLQVVEKSEEHEYMMVAFEDIVAAEHGGIKGDEIADLCPKDRDVYATFWKSLETAVAMAGERAGEGKELVEPRIRKLTSMIEGYPKSFVWRMRARIGGMSG